LVKPLEKLTLSSIKWVFFLGNAQNTHGAQQVHYHKARIH